MNHFNDPDRKEQEVSVRGHEECDTLMRRWRGEEEESIRQRVHTVCPTSDVHYILDYLRKLVITSFCDHKR